MVDSFCSAALRDDNHALARDAVQKGPSTPSMPPGGIG
jgi:hypothetical protein